MKFLLNIVSKSVVLIIDDIAKIDSNKNREPNTYTTMSLEKDFSVIFNLELLTSTPY